MSATPVINTLAEAKSLLEMIQGIEFPDLETTLSMTNVAAMYKALVLFGVRAIPRYSTTASPSRRRSRTRWWTGSSPRAISRNARRS
jgi:hypothetical protein